MYGVHDGSDGVGVGVRCSHGEEGAEGHALLHVDVVVHGVEAGVVVIDVLHHHANRSGRVQAVCREIAVNSYSTKFGAYI